MKKARRQMAECRSICQEEHLSNIRRLAVDCRAIGDVAEVGVYRGGTAKVLCDAFPDRTVHLYDTFCGMPDIHTEFDIGCRSGEFGDTSLDEVKEYVDSKNAMFHPGLFPLTAVDAVYAFVHLDGDMYETTLAGLKFFCPRMSAGGVIVFHDYDTDDCPGVRAAVDDYGIEVSSSCGSQPGYATTRYTIRTS